MQPLPDRQTAHAQRVGAAQHLVAPARPAAALDQERIDVLGGEADGQHLVVVDASPASSMQEHPRVGILDHRLGGDAPDRSQRRATDDSRAPPQNAALFRSLPGQTMS